MTGSILLALLSATLVTFLPPHAAHVPSAVLAPELTRTLDAQVDRADPHDAQALADSILTVTDEQLHFGLAHRTSLQFATSEREANCIEYSQLFAAAFNRSAARRHIAARALVVHSDARVLGRRVGEPALNDHDWVLVVPTSERTGLRRLFIDPTFHDFGLGSDIASNVIGEVPVPK